jgi:hypothetical protein
VDIDVARMIWLVAYSHSAWLVVSSDGSGPVGHE